MPLFTTSSKRLTWREKRRGWLTGKLIGVPCPACPAVTGSGCDYWAETGDDLIQLNRDSQLFAHATRVADALIAHPAIRSLALAQFEKDTAPACLTAPAAALPVSEPVPAPARQGRYDPAGYRSSARKTP